eukprot:315787-Rhodomonas_salina.1
MDGRQGKEWYTQTKAFSLKKRKSNEVELAWLFLQPLRSRTFTGIVKQSQIKHAKGVAPLACVVYNQAGQGLDEYLYLIGSLSHYKHT